MEKQHGRLITDKELTAAYRFATFYEKILQDSSVKDFVLRQRLIEHPNGFILEGGYTCLVCGLSFSNGTFWYDQQGVKCTFCQRALDKKLDLIRYLKSGLLKKLIVPSDRRRPHLELFLVRDNRNVLPPKKLLQFKLVKVMRDGEEWFTREEWYECVDEKKTRKLEKYKIFEILKETLAKPIISRRIYCKSTNPLFLFSE